MDDSHVFVPVAPSSVEYHFSNFSLQSFFHPSSNFVFLFVLYIYSPLQTFRRRVIRMIRFKREYEENLKKTAHSNSRSSSIFFYIFQSVSFRIATSALAKMHLCSLFFLIKNFNLIFQQKFNVYFFGWLIFISWEFCDYQTRWFIF